MKKEIRPLEYGHVVALLLSLQTVLLGILGPVLDNPALVWFAVPSAIFTFLFYCEAENSKIKLFPWVNQPRKRRSKTAGLESPTTNSTSSP